MATLTENQVKKDLLASFTLGVVSSMLYGVAITRTFLVEYINNFGIIASFIISLGFLVAVYFSFKAFGKRLVSLKLLMVNQDE